MRRRLEGAWILAALTTFGMTMASGRAEGGTALGGISVKGGVTQGGDPQYTYYLDIFLENDTIPAYVNPGPPVATVSFTGLTGVSSIDTYQINHQYLPAPQEQIGPPILGTGTAEIDFFDLSPISTSHTIQLLELVIVTPPDTPSGLSPGDSITYSYTIGSQSGGGAITLTQGPLGVPEPSSMLLMLAGVPVLRGLGIRHRRRLRSRGLA